MAQLRAAVARATEIAGAYGHMVSVEPRELARAKDLIKALEAWEVLSAQLDAVLRQDLQDDDVFENLFSLLQQAEEISAIP